MREEEGAPGGVKDVELGRDSIESWEIGREFSSLFLYIFWQVIKSPPNIYIRNFL